MAGAPPHRLPASMVMMAPRPARPRRWTQHLRQQAVEYMWAARSTLRYASAAHSLLASSACPQHMPNCIDVFTNVRRSQLSRHTVAIEHADDCRYPRRIESRFHVHRRNARRVTSLRCFLQDAFERLGDIHRLIKPAKSAEVPWERREVAHDLRPYKHVVQFLRNR